MGLEHGTDAITASGVQSRPAQPTDGVGMSIMDLKIRLYRLHNEDANAVHLIDGVAFPDLDKMTLPFFKEQIMATLPRDAEAPDKLTVVCRDRSTPNTPRKYLHEVWCCAFGRDVSAVSSPTHPTGACG